jgi:hypothetical protein
MLADPSIITADGPSDAGAHLSIGFFYLMIVRPALTQVSLA